MFDPLHCGCLPKVGIKPIPLAAFRFPELHKANFFFLKSFFPLLSSCKEFYPNLRRTTSGVSLQNSPAIVAASGAE